MSNKKLFEIVNNNPKKLKDIKVGGRNLKFNKQGMVQIRDAGLARDIQQSIGQDGSRDAVVIDVPNNDERGIQLFSLPKGDWKERIDWSK